jgi:sucrose-6-phosphate hydrolase SacC (GH32 family)
MSAVPTMIYHGLDSGTCIASSSDDDLIRWTKSSRNPVIRQPKEGGPNHGRYHVWDTCGWVKDGMYYSISGDHPDRAPATDGDIAYLFRSPDLVDWEYVHPFYKSDRRWTPADEDCSCPDFFPLGRKHVLMFISHTQGPQYYIGRYENDRFHPESHGKMNWPGGPVFAQDSLVDDKGHRIMWAWACESRDRETQLAGGWSGVMTMPRVLSLSEAGTMLINPPEEIAKLRMNPRIRKDLAVRAGDDIMLSGIAGNSLELSLEVDLREDSEFGVKVGCSPAGTEETVIVYDDSSGVLRIDTTRSSLSDDIFQPFPYPQAAWFPKEVRQSEDIRIQEAPFHLRSGELLKLRVFLDRSILEVFANGRQCVTQRIYPSRADSTQVRLFCKGSAVTVRFLRAWDMARANAL